MLKRVYKFYFDKINILSDFALRIHKPLSIFVLILNERN